MTGSHDLVVGGSGMLADLCERLASAGRNVSVVARGSDRLAGLARRCEAAPGRINPVRVDYRDASALKGALKLMAAEHGAPTRTVCWVHETTAPDAALEAAAFTEGVFWHILGSAAADPARPDILADRRARFYQRRPDLDYRQVILGFQFEPDGRSRWLTDSEISDGAWAALTTSATLTAVGAIEPWSRRP
jgi:NAD(P)-dependent dehydrogenase (short-subunit alcohol dehydrogenase family)